MFFKYIWLLPLLASVYLLYSSDYLREIQRNFTSKGLSIIDIIYSGFNEKITPALKKTSAEQKVFTIDELKKYTNLENGLYIAILGQVYDVTKGAKHYGPGATYHAFTGRDASLAFLTGEFTSKGLTDDVSSLSVQQIKDLNDWVQFYNENYVYKGKLIGRYYNKDGTPTAESHNVQQKVIRAKEEKFEGEQRKRMFPPCNIEWTPESGTVVWCSKRSGGIERDWIGVPRMLYDSPSSRQYRCACIKLDSREYEEAKGTIREYIGCAKSSTKCTVKVNNL